MWSQPELRGLPARANTFNAADLVQPKPAPVIPNPFLPTGRGGCLLSPVEIAEALRARGDARPSLTFNRLPEWYRLLGDPRQRFYMAEAAEQEDPDADYAAWLQKRERQLKR